MWWSTVRPILELEFEHAAKVNLQQSANSTDKYWVSGWIEVIPRVELALRPWLHPQNHRHPLLHPPHLQSLHQTSTAQNPSDRTGKAGYGCARSRERSGTSHCIFPSALEMNLMSAGNQLKCSANGTFVAALSSWFRAWYYLHKPKTSRNTFLFCGLGNISPNEQNSRPHRMEMKQGWVNIAS